VGCTSTRNSGAEAEVRGVTYYFCSENCMREFLAAEKELAGSSRLRSPPRRYCPSRYLLLTYAPLLPAQLTNYLLFALETPIQFVVGWRSTEGHTTA